MAKKAKLSQTKKQELKLKMLKFRSEAEDGNKAAFIRMTENERFKIGKQWDEDDTSFNEAHGKFSLTVNEVLPIVLDIAGTEEENPLDYKVRNVKGGTQTIAEILTSLVKNVMDKSMGREEASRSFESGVSIARGFLYVPIDYRNDPLNGDLVVKELDPFMVLPDPTCKTYDYNKQQGGAKYIWVDEWEDKGKMEAMYPGKELKSANFDPTSQGLWGRFAGVMGRIFGGGPNLYLKDDYRHHDEHNTTEEELQGNVTKQTNNYRVSTCWWKEWKKGAYVQRLDDPLNYLALTDPKDIKYAKTLAEDNENLRVIEKDRYENQLTVPQLNKTVMLGDILLEHIEDPFDGMNLYPIVRFAPYFDHGYEYPPVENLKGPQKLINYTFSSLVNILKNLANSGWKVGKAGQRAIEWLEEHGGEDGLVINLSKFGDKVEKIDTTDYPTGFDIITERGKQNMREISQVQLEVPVRKAESGRALAIREHQSLKTKGIIFRNWNQTNILVARLMVELIRNNDIFSDDEILAIIDEEDLLDDKILDQAKGIIINQIQFQGGRIPQQPQPPNPIRVRNASVEMQAQMLDSFRDEMLIFQQFVEQVEQAAIPIAKEIILKLLRKMQQGRYGIKVDTSPMAPTVRMMRRLETLELDKQLIEGGRQGISRKKLIEISDVQDKEEIIAEEVPIQGAA
jgi:hypothetical protein